jgi:hypothetical protein
MDLTRRLCARQRKLHTVTLPERGTGNQTPQSAGASLFVVYRDTTPATGQARRVYDGAHIQAKGELTTQKIRGFLQSDGAWRGSRRS